VKFVGGKYNFFQYTKDWVTFLGENKK